MNDRTPEYFYGKGSDELPEWSIFSAIKFSLFEKYESNNDRGGSFFRYLVKNCTKTIVGYLKRLLMFDPENVQLNMVGLISFSFIFKYTIAVEDRPSLFLNIECSNTNLYEHE